MGGTVGTPGPPNDRVSGCAFATPARILAATPLADDPGRMTDDVFSHDQEVALCRRLLGDRAHGLETLVDEEP